MLVLSAVYLCPEVIIRAICVIRGSEMIQKCLCYSVDHHTDR